MFELINKNKAVIQVLHQNKPLQPLLEHGNISFAKNGYVNLLIENDNAEVTAKQVIEKIRKSFVVVG